MKYIIDIPNELAEATVRYWSETTDMTLVPYIEPNRKAIEDEVWEFAQKFTHESKAELNAHERMEIWGTASCDKIINDFTYSEAKSKYEAWKKQKYEIRVGDEVEYFCGDNIRFVVCGIDNGVAYGFKYRPDFEDLDIGEYCEIDELKKTGRHFPEVAELLKKMGGEEQ